WEQAASRDRTLRVFSGARPGQVYVVPAGKMRGPVVVVGSERSKRGEPRLLAITRDRRLVRLSPRDFSHPPRAVAQLALAAGGEGVRPRVDHATRRRLAIALAALEVPAAAWEPSPGATEDSQPDLSVLRSRILSHPCRLCGDLDRHAQWGERASRLEAEIDDLRERVRARTETLSHKFQRVLRILEEYGYVKDFELAPKGSTLARIYNESDLVVAEALTKGWFSGLKAAELAAAVSTFVFESRGPFEVVGMLPTSGARRLYGRLLRQVERIRLREERVGLDLTRGTQTGFAEVIYRWCRGASLEEVLDEELPAGDFIRACKQTVDLMRQMRDVTDDPELERVLAAAIAGVNRGVVAYTGII
ncbi:MAG: DEAD/DEAH box helicase, partial [Actinomycetota bacterium]